MMCKRFILFILLISLLIAGCAQVQTPQLGYGVKYEVKVIDVIDGDTIEVQFQDRTETIRILGIDTPEIVAEKNKPYEYKTSNLECLADWGLKAKKFVNSKLNGKTVQIEFDEKAGLKDKFGRLLAYVYVDGKDFGKMLVEKGYARVYVEGEFSKRNEYLKAEERAFNSGIGIWSCRIEEILATQTPLTPTPILTPTPTPTKETLTAPIPAVPPSLKVSKVIIYAFDQNPAGHDSGKEWIMLYNPLNYGVDIGGWKFRVTNWIRVNSYKYIFGGYTYVEIPKGTIIAPKSYWTYVHSTQWLNDSSISIALIDRAGNSVDSVTVSGDDKDDNRYWYRISLNGLAFSTKEVERIPPSPPQTATLEITPETEVASIPEVKIYLVHYDAAGYDHYNLNDEYVVVKNYGDKSVNLGGWELRDEYGHTYVFPDVTLNPGCSATIYSGSGEDITSGCDLHLYWGRTWAVWNNDHDTAYLYDSLGRLIDSYSW